MGKKRKASGKPFGERQQQDEESTRINLRVNTYEDVADSEDDFHLNRDKILLGETPDEKSRRNIEEHEEFLQPSDEEVLAYSSSTSDGGGEQDDDDDATDDERRLLHKKPRLVSESESSVASEDEGDAGGWGTSKKEYYNADVIETEADALEEEQEARKLQQKRLQAMTEADFGFDESEWLQSGEAEEDGQDDQRDGVVTEVLPQPHVTDDMGPEERVKTLRLRYPEFEPLSKEFLELQPMHKDLAIAAASAEALTEHAYSHKSVNGESEHKKVNVGLTKIATVKFRALSVYLGVLSMYFALLTSTSKANDGSIAIPSAELRDHPVMDSLVECRQLWEKVKDLRIPDASEILPVGAHDHDQSQEKQVINDQDHTLVEGPAIQKPPESEKKSKAQRAAEAAQAEAEARRAERARRVEEDLASLSQITTARTKRKPTSASIHTTVQTNGDDSDFGEESALTPQEAAEKAKRKKTLRFYTSQIAQKANKRDAAGRDAGGDADLPYRERLKDRQARLNAEAEKRGKSKTSARGDPLGGESDEDDRRVAEEMRHEAGSEEDYYDMVAARSKQKKAEKASLAAARQHALNEGGRVAVQEEVGPDRKRAITYTIEKNKGLAPKRKKDVRNPRVKKRKKFEEKKKKLGSVRQVYKGGEGRGGYGGELTGIKKGLVKSVKL